MGKTSSKTFTFDVQPPPTALQNLGGGRLLNAPGCFACVIRDPRGDDHGGPPDIKSVSSTFKNGWITFTFVTYDAVSAGHGGHPCIDGITRPGPHESGFGAGCFEGPHTGMIFGAVCAHPDANQDCGSAHMAFPNSHTTVYHFRPAQIGNPASFYWDAWVLYPGDVFKDTAPSSGERPGPGQAGVYCQVKQQLKRQPPSAFSWGKNLCRQNLVPQPGPEFTSGSRGRGRCQYTRPQLGHVLGGVSPPVAASSVAPIVTTIGAPCVLATNDDPSAE